MYETNVPVLQVIQDMIATVAREIIRNGWITVDYSEEEMSHTRC